MSLFSRARSFATVLSVVLLSSLGAAAVIAQETAVPTPGETRMEWYAKHDAMRAASPFGNLAWQYLGPTNISGRITDLAVVTPRGASYTVYVAGASGGVWKTTNEGVTWEPIFEHGPSTSIGDVTLAPSDPEIVWIGTGEANIFRSSMAGAGVFKSTDGGATFEHKGLTSTHTIPRIVVHPTDANTVWVAASGHEWSDNPERGVYKSTDGGDTWEQVFYIDERTAVIDLVADPSDPDTLYAATWQRIRRKWNDPRNEDGYSGSAIYKSTDGGSNWSEISGGLPDAQYRGRIGIDVSASNPQVVYAFIDNYEIERLPEDDETDAYGRPRAPLIRAATVYRSDDGGASWRQTSENNPYMQNLGGTYGWVFGQIRVDPVNEDKIYVMGLALNVSEDAGKTFRRLTGMHGDHHGLWIDPANPDYLVNSNDGGVDFSYDGGENWRNFNENLPLVQFFNVGNDMDEPFRVYGSVQDHGSFSGPVDLSRGRDNIPAQVWDRAPGGEGSSHAVDPTDPSVVYSAGFYGRISRTHLDTGESINIVPVAEEGEPPLRGQWVAPFIVSPHNPRIIYHGMNMLYRSMDRGDTWERLSDDLTYNELDKIGDIPYQTIFSISESPLKFGLVYVGTDDGRVWVTGQGELGWTEITGELPRGKFIAEIVASKYDESTVFMTQNGKRDDDFKPYLWMSTDYGTTWQDIAANIPSGPVNVIKEDPKNSNVLYVGTDLGAYASVDRGVTWHSLPLNMPDTFVQDMIIHPRDDILVAATHGRGMWALDVRPIQQLTAEVQEAPLHLFDIESVQLPQRRQGFFGGGGVSTPMYYWLAATTTVNIVVKDGEGKVIKTLEGSGDAGLNTASWNLSLDDAPAPRPGGFRRPNLAAPGTYTVVVTAGEAAAEGSVTVRR